jgi:hypothetical protein
MPVCLIFSVKNEGDKTIYFPAELVASRSRYRVTFVNGEGEEHEQQFGLRPLKIGDEVYEIGPGREVWDCIWLEDFSELPLGEYTVVLKVESEGTYHKVLVNDDGSIRGVVRAECWGGMIAASASATHVAPEGADRDFYERMVGKRDRYTGDHAFEEGVLDRLDAVMLREESEEGLDELDRSCKGLRYREWVISELLSALWKKGTLRRLNAEELKRMKTYAEELRGSSLRVYREQGVIGEIRSQALAGDRKGASRAAKELLVRGGLLQTRMKHVDGILEWIETGRRGPSPPRTSGA